MISNIGIWVTAPRSDFAICHREFLFCISPLIGEVVSIKHGMLQDKHRMVLQGLRQARIADFIFLDDSNAPSVLVMAVYVDRDFKAHRFFFIAGRKRPSQLRVSSSSRASDAPRADLPIKGV